MAKLGLTKNETPAQLCTEQGFLRHFSSFHRSSSSAIHGLRYTHTSLLLMLPVLLLSGYGSL